MTDMDNRGNALKGRLSKNNTQTDDDSSDNSTESETTEQTSKTRKTSSTSKTEGPSRTSSTVKERKNVNMYLEEALVEEINNRFREINARRTLDGKDELEKNRDFYPALARAALDSRSIEDVLADDE